MSHSTVKETTIGTVQMKQMKTSPGFFSLQFLTMDPFTWILPHWSFKVKVQNMCSSQWTLILSWEMFVEWALRTESGSMWLEVLLTEKQSNAGQCVHVMFLWKLTSICPGGPVDWPHDSVLCWCSGTGLRVQSPSWLYLIPFICRTKFFSPVSSTLGSFPNMKPFLWFQDLHRDVHAFICPPLDLCPGPVHTCSSGSLHHFQLVQLLLRSSTLKENMIIELLALCTHQLWKHVLTSGSDIFWRWSSSRRLSVSDSFTATGTCGNIQRRGGAETHISMITMVTLSWC